MRTVPGPTERVVVVGAGLAGLSAALRLAGAGRHVT
ncbi:MAG: FAD-binding protein, partial [Geodermatophilaceae bacterium]|nr:FAD-binding protein [Geodermatophilaceae bacterium]